MSGSLLFGQSTNDQEMLAEFKPLPFDLDVLFLRFDGNQQEKVRNDHVLQTTANGVYNGRIVNVTALTGHCVKTLIAKFLSSSENAKLLVYMGHSTASFAWCVGNDCVEENELATIVLRNFKGSKLTLGVVSCFGDCFTNWENTMRAWIPVEVICTTTSMRNPKEVRMGEDSNVLTKIYDDTVAHAANLRYLVNFSTEEATKTVKDISWD